MLLCSHCFKRLRRWCHAEWRPFKCTSLNTASIPDCIKGGICFHNWVSPKSRNITLEFGFVCSCCTKNHLPMWIRLGCARLSLNMTIRDTDFFFQYPGSVFLALLSLSESQYILSKFCSLERGDRAKAKAFCPCVHTPLPCTHQLTHFLT